VADSLRPGAGFLLDYGAAAEVLLVHWKDRTWYPAGDILVLVENHHDLVGSRIRTQLTFLRDGSREQRRFSQRIYTYRELSGLLATAGFTNVQGYGSLAGESFSLGARRLLLVGWKPKP
jgi:hypothetical protein